MMSIRALGNLGDGGAAAKAASHYYSEKSADYYVQEASPEPEGEWIGTGAERMGLGGGPHQGPNRAPEREELQLALAGYAGGRHVQNAGRADRQMGWDVTFSAPKSVSLAWGLADDPTRLALERAHRTAARVAHDYLAEQITTRRGYAGKVRQQAHLLSAQFTHHTSRAGDPQLHSHIVIPNFCVRHDGTVGTIESKAFYDHKLTAGALYQAELAYRVRELGFEVEKGASGTFKIAGVDKRLEDLFSKRDRQIDRLAAEQGIRTYAGTRGVVLATRPPKQHTTLRERQGTWRQEAKASGLAMTVTRAGRRLARDINEEVWGTMRKLGEKLTEQASVFYEKDFVRELARSTYGLVNAKQVMEYTEQARQDRIFISLGAGKSGQPALTTPQMANLEREMIHGVWGLVKKKGYEVDASKVFADMGYLSAEQKGSVLSATADYGIAVIQGRAGAGKTTTLAAIRGAYARAGYIVQGLALSGQAASNMEKEAGIPSRTIATWKKEPEIAPKTVLIVDEAGMVGSRGTKEILERANRFGAKVILVGDERQLQPIEAGGALHAVDRELVKYAPSASSQIETIRRQKEVWMREAVHHAATGQTGQALEALDHHGHIEIYESAAAARRKLVRGYVERNATSQDKGVILTHRKSDAGRLNELVREELKERGLVGEDKIELDNGQRKLKLAVGDRLMFGKNEYRELDVRNGQRGTLKAIDEKAQTLEVRMDSGQDKTVQLGKYHAIDYGWASTTHKAQGMTVDRAYVYGHTKEPMANQHSTYVQISRAREETRIYAVAGERSIERSLEQEGFGPELPWPWDKNEKKEERERALKEMGKTWGREAMKDTTLDYPLEKQRELERQRMEHQHTLEQQRRQRENDRGMDIDD